MYVYFYSLHVLGNYVPIIRRTDCINATPGICYSDVMTAPLNLHLNPVFHTWNQAADSKELSSHLNKLAGKSGQLNLSGRGITSESHIPGVTWIQLILMMGT